MCLVQTTTQLVLAITNTAGPLLYVKEGERNLGNKRSAGTEQRWLEGEDEA